MIPWKDAATEPGISALRMAPRIIKFGKVIDAFSFMLPTQNLVIDVKAKVACWKQQTGDVALPRSF